MNQGNVFGTGGSRVTVTPAQQRLLQYCNHLEASHIAKHLASVHDLATYFTPLDQVDQDSSYCAKELQEIMSAIAAEDISNRNNPAQ